MKTGKPGGVTMDKKCKHEWYIFRMSPSFRKAFPQMAGWGRECVRCECLEYLSDDRKRWDAGLKGVLVNGQEAQ